MVVCVATIAEEPELGGGGLGEGLVPPLVESKDLESIVLPSFVSDTCEMRVRWV